MDKGHEFYNSGRELFRHRNRLFSLSPPAVDVEKIKYIFTIATLAPPTVLTLDLGDITILVELIINNKLYIRLNKVQI